LSPFVLSAIIANQELSRALKDIDFDKLCSKHSLGAGGDISTEADLIAEEIFVKHLKQYGEIDSEESFQNIITPNG